MKTDQIIEFKEQHQSLSNVMNSLCQFENITGDCLENFSNDDLSCLMRKLDIVSDKINNALTSRRNQGIENHYNEH